MRADNEQLQALRMCARASDGCSEPGCAADEQMGADELRAARRTAMAGALVSLMGSYVASATLSACPCADAHPRRTHTRTQTAVRTWCQGTSAADASLWLQVMFLCLRFFFFDSNVL